MKWYEHIYINKINWILDNLEKLGLTSDEFKLVMIIQFMNENNLDISLEELRNKSGFNEEKLDQVISTLVAKHYLDIRASSRRISMVLDGLYDTKLSEKKDINAELFDSFEAVFKRPLSQLELQKISDLTKQYDKMLIMYALREASAYNALSIDYVQRILDTWSLKNVTVEMIEKNLV